MFDYFLIAQADDKDPVDYGNIKLNKVVNSIITFFLTSFFRYN